MPTPNRTPRRALELLDASPDGCTAAILLTHPFKSDRLVELINAGLASVTTERVIADDRGLEGLALEGGPHHILCCDDPFGAWRAIETGLVKRFNPGQQCVGNFNCGVRIG
jgi:hypothetical protein